MQLGLQRKICYTTLCCAMLCYIRGTYSLREQGRWRLHAMPYLRAFLSCSVLLFSAPSRGCHVSTSPVTRKMWPAWMYSFHRFHRCYAVPNSSMLSLPKHGHAHSLRFAMLYLIVLRTVCYARSASPCLCCHWRRQCPSPCPLSISISMSVRIQIQSQS